jgi:hypothetical protein
MDQWYFVKNKNRQGPVNLEVIQGMISKQELGPDDHVWKKGFENWSKIKDVSELRPKEELPSAFAAADISLKDLGDHDRVVYVRIGNDRGAASTDYGPFNLNQLKKLYKENRINGKTFVFIKGMSDFKVLADYKEFQEIFEDMPPVIKDDDRRSNLRKPFIARMFFENNKNFFEGICRDISTGGMQILMDEFKGKAGDSISINVHPENTDYHFTASGVVVRVLEGSSGFSFRFERLSEEARGSIEKYLRSN